MDKTSKKTSLQQWRTRQGDQWSVDEFFMGKMVPMKEWGKEGGEDDDRSKRGTGFHVNY